MAHARPHSHISGAGALTNTSLEELIRPGLFRAFPLPSGDDANEEKFRQLLAVLAQQGRLGPRREGR